MAGLLDFTSPESAAMLGLGAGLLQASGPSRMPVSFGQALGGGLLMSNELLQAARVANNRSAFVNAETQYRLQQGDLAQRQVKSYDEGQRAIQAFRANLPPTEWAAFDLNPSGYLASKSKRTKLSPGEVLLNERDEPMLQAPFAPQAGSPLAKMVEEMNALPPGSPLRAVYEQAIQKATTHAPGTNVTVGYGAPVAGVDPSGKPVFFQPPNRAGEPSQLVTVPGVGQIAPPPEKSKEPGDTEKAAAGYAQRMIASESVLERVGAAGLPSYTTQAAGAVPGVGRYAQSEVMTPQQQMFRQAQEDWVRAKLRKESGAVIAKDEMEDEIRTYFPQPGDRPETIAQKAQARATATQAMLQQGGRATPQARPGPQAPPQPAGGEWRIVR